MRVLPPWVLQVFGLGIIAVFVVVKLTTGEESALLVGVGVTLATIGGVTTAADRLLASLRATYSKEEE